MKINNATMNDGDNRDGVGVEKEEEKRKEEMKIWDKKPEVVWRRCR